MHIQFNPVCAHRLINDGALRNSEHFMEALVSWFIKLQQIGNEWANPQTLYVLPNSIVYKTYVHLSSQDVNVNNGIKLYIIALCWCPYPCPWDLGGHGFDIIVHGWVSFSGGYGWA